MNGRKTGTEMWPGSSGENTRSQVQIPSTHVKSRTWRGSMRKHAPGTLWLGAETEGSWGLASQPV